MVYTRQMTGNNTNSGLLEWNPDGLPKYTRSSPSTSHAGHFNDNLQYCKALSLHPVQSTTTTTINLLDLPPEVLEKILRYLPYKNICALRLVCRPIERICGQILNMTFIRLQNQMLTKFQEIKSRMPRRESARRSHHLACESDIIETLHMRLNLLQMSFGKHIERKHICFFPGEILDEVYRILHYIKVTPKLDLPYKVTDELFDLSTMAMEYFKDKIEPNLPEIAFFSADFLKFSRNFASPTALVSEVSKDSGHASTDEMEEGEDLVETIPQSNMVLRKRIRKIKQGMKRYNSQLSLLRQDLRSCKRKTSEQQKQISEQQKQISDQQKQTLEYATRLDEYDKKNEEMSRKLSTLLQELNKCKTELQYWRCKSPATQSVCNHCGNVIVSQSEPLVEVFNQSFGPEALLLEQEIENSVAVENNAHNQVEEEIVEKDKKIIDQPSTSAPEKAKSIKRKSEEGLSAGAVKKTRRLSKVRGKRTKV